MMAIGSSSPSRAGSRCEACLAARRALGDTHAGSHQIGELSTHISGISTRASQEAHTMLSVRTLAETLIDDHEKNRKSHTDKAKQ